MINLVKPSVTMKLTCKCGLVLIIYGEFTGSGGHLDIKTLIKGLTNSGCLEAGIITIV